MSTVTRDNLAEDSQGRLRQFFHGLAVATITRPSRRDRQKAPGPSDLANKCDLCVAKRIADFLGVPSGSERTFSLKAWLGTAVHEKLERDLKALYPHALQEVTVTIGDVPGIGVVVGHVDIFLPRKRAIGDWKTTDLEKLEGYRTRSGPAAYTQGLTAQERRELDALKDLERSERLPQSKLPRMIELMSRAKEHSGGVPEEYKGQTMLYLMGLRAMGFDVEYAVLVFIPRDSNNVEDIWVASCKYSEEVATAVIRRATRLAQRVREGQLHSIDPHPKCFPCVIRPRLKR